MKIWFTVELDQGTDAALAKLKTFKKLNKSEVVNIGLDMVLQLPPDEIAARIKKKREREHDLDNMECIGY